MKKDLAKRIHIYIDEGLLKFADKMAEKYGISRSSYFQNLAMVDRMEWESLARSELIKDKMPRAADMTNEELIASIKEIDLLIQKHE